MPRIKSFPFGGRAIPLMKRKGCLPSGKPERVSRINENAMFVYVEAYCILFAMVYACATAITAGAK